jgi:pyridoxal phosphate enzyme (YggS family)
MGTLQSLNTTMKPEYFQENVARIQEKIGAAARRAGKRPEDVTLVGVSKTHSAESIRMAYEAGIRHFGENRVQEWEGKRAAVADLNATWHLIGHLQSNKAGRAARLFNCIDSIDDFAVAQRLGRTREETPSAKLRVLIEVHVAGEETKSGAAIADLPALAEKIRSLPGLSLAGLMCIPPYFAEIELVRPYFRHLRQLRDDLARQTGMPLPVLSMGMSHDFEVAIEEGATEVRIGSALFGSRLPSAVSS